MQNDVILVLGEAQGGQQAATEVLPADDLGAAVQPRGKVSIRERVLAECRIMSFPVFGSWVDY